MKINFIVPELTRTGGTRIIFEFANRMADRGHDVKMYSRITPFNPLTPKVKKYYLKYQVKRLLLYMKGKAIPKNMFEHRFELKIVPAMRNFFIDDADAVIATSWPTAHIVNRLSRSKGKKFYFIQDYEKWNANVEMVDKSYKLNLNRIVIAEHLRLFFKEKFGVESALIRYGVDFNHFDNRDKVYHSPLRILFLDHSLENKNSVLAIEICRRLKGLFPEIIIKSFGMQKYHQMPDYFEFTENPDDDEIAKLYRDSDIFICPTLFEGCPATPVEAMACKCALAANAAAEIPYYSVNNESAILADKDKPEELFIAAKYLLENPSELKKISENGYKHVREIFNWERSVDQFEELLKSSN